VAASVRIEDEAFSDARIEILGSLLGTSRYDALGRLAYIWRQATAMGKDILPEAMIAHHLSVDALVSSGLGVKTQKGVRLKGAKGRIDWLERKREAGRLNGHLGAEFGKRGGRPPKTPKEPGEGVSKNPPPAPAPAPATSPALPNSADEFGFDAFWIVWPKKVAKPAAIRAWAKLAPTRELFERIVADVRYRLTTPDWLKESGQYIPFPATYLNGHRWEDETPGRPGAHQPDPAAGRKEETQRMLRDQAEKLKRIQDEQRSPE
jgi:hypothetical protein